MASSTITTMPVRSRSFAPLDPARDNKYKSPRLKGVVFDVDGTLW